MMSSQSMRRISLGLTLLCIAAAGVFLRSGGDKTQPKSSVETTPESCIDGLLAAEQSGEPRRYLACFADSEQEKRKLRWQGLSESQIAGELRSQCAGLVGRSISDLKQTDEQHAELTLERIYEDHIERQLVTLLRDQGPWQIDQLPKPEWQRPAIPYGTPVSQQE